MSTRRPIVVGAVAAIGAAGLFLIQTSEGKENCAYADPASPLARELRKPEAKRAPGWRALSGAPWTIGYGHTGPEVKPGLCISDRKADEYLLADIRIAQVALSKCVKAPVYQTELDAMTSITMNAGGANICPSTLVAKVNRQDYAGAANEFPRWVYARGQVLDGLVKRRACERRLFLADPTKPAHAYTTVKACILEGKG